MRHTGFMIECDICKDWFHGQNVTRSKALILPLSEKASTEGDNSFIVDGSNEPKKIRVNFTENQRDRLEESWQTSNYPDKQEVQKLALEIGITELRVRTWFKQQRSCKEEWGIKKDQAFLYSTTTIFSHWLNTQEGLR